VKLFIYGEKYSNKGYTWHLDTDDENEYTKAWRESMEVATFEQRRRRHEEEKDGKGDEYIDGILYRLVETYIPQYAKKENDAGQNVQDSQAHQQDQSKSNKSEQSLSASSTEPPAKPNKLSYIY